MMIQLTLCLGVVLSVVGVLFIRPISYLLGATDSMIEDCVLYGRVVLSFNTAFMLQNVLQTFWRPLKSQSSAWAATVAAGVTNMALDALFIVGFGWGVAGAALATGLSQCIGGILPLLYFLRPNSSLLRLTKTRPEGTVLLKACANGSSELMTSISGSLVSMLYNFQLLKFAGETAWPLSAFLCIFSLFSRPFYRLHNRNSPHRGVPLRRGKLYGTEKPAA